MLNKTQQDAKAQLYITGHDVFSIRLDSGMIGIPLIIDMALK